MVVPDMAARNVGTWGEDTVPCLTSAQRGAFAGGASLVPLVGDGGVGDGGVGGDAGPPLAGWTSTADARALLFTQTVTCKQNTRKAHGVHVQNLVTAQLGTGAALVTAPQQPMLHPPGTQPVAMY